MCFGTHTADTSSCAETKPGTAAIRVDTAAAAANRETFLRRLMATLIVCTSAQRRLRRLSAASPFPRAIPPAKARLLPASSLAVDINAPAGFRVDPPL